MTRAILSLGSNVEPRGAFLARARDALQDLPGTRISEASAVRETAPVGVPDEFKSLKFLNQIVVCETDLDVFDFARRMHGIEDALGRVRTVRNGPRTIDLDLVDFGGRVLSTPELTLPHPRAHERSFVQEPLKELGLTVNREVTLGHARDALARGERVLLLVRHAERGVIEGEDKTFGAALPLTKAGEKMSEKFGACLKGAATDVQFLASPLKRTVMTARCIAKGMGIVGPEIPTDAEIANGSAYVADELEVWDLFREGRFFKEMIAYLERGTQRGFAPLKEATEAFEAHALERFTGQLGIFTTHDVYIAAYAKARGLVARFAEPNWPRFLDAVAIVVKADGAVADRAFVRAGLTDRYRGVS